MVFKPLLQTDGACPIIEKTRGGKALKMVYAEGGSRRTRIVDTSAAERESFVLDDEVILQLASWAVLIEQHYIRHMDMEWATHGETGEPSVVPARQMMGARTGRAIPINNYPIA